jgi:hypothetical protein
VRLAAGLVTGASPFGNGLPRRPSRLAAGLVAGASPFGKRLA